MTKGFNGKMLLLILFVLGVVILVISIGLYIIETPDKWIPELAKALMGLSFTVIFGGIIKLIFDKYQEEKKKEEKKKDEDKIKRDKIAAFKSMNVQALRKVFDQVDSARLLIEAHQSAKTYGEKMQQNIYPSIVTLFDIKRGLVDSKDMLEPNNLLQLRVNIHYMIAYLQALANEYKKHYSTISHKQFLHEELKETQGVIFVSELIKEFPDDYFSSKRLMSAEVVKKIQQPPKWVWEAIQELTHMGLFIKDKYDSPYRKMFVDFYEHSKKILKDQPVDKLPKWYEEDKMKGQDRLARMLEIDALAKSDKLKEGDNLVQELLHTLIERTEEYSKW